MNALALNGGRVVGGRVVGGRVVFHHFVSVQGLRMKVKKCRKIYYSCRTIIPAAQPKNSPLRD